MPRVILAVDNDSVHQTNPLLEVLRNGNLGLVHDRAPVWVYLSDCEDTAVRHTEVRAR